MAAIGRRRRAPVHGPLGHDRHGAVEPHRERRAGQQERTAGVAFLVGPDVEAASRRHHVGARHAARPLSRKNVAVTVAGCGLSLPIEQERLEGDRRVAAGEPLGEVPGRAAAGDAERVMATAEVVEVHRPFGDYRLVALDDRGEPLAGQRRILRSARASRGCQARWSVDSVTLVAVALQVARRDRCPGAARVGDQDERLEDACRALGQDPASRGRPHAARAGAPGVRRARPAGRTSIVRRRCRPGCAGVLDDGGDLRGSGAVQGGELAPDVDGQASRGRQREDLLEQLRRPA